MLMWCCVIFRFLIWKLLNGKRWTKFPNPLSHYSRNNLHIGSLHVQGIAWYVVYMVICGLSLESYDHTLRTICDFKLSIVTLECHILLSQVGCKSYNERLSGPHAELCTGLVEHKAACSGWPFKRASGYCNRCGNSLRLYSGHILNWFVILCVPQEIWLSECLF